jgi:hypothetical protein
MNTMAPGQLVLGAIIIACFVAICAAASGHPDNAHPPADASDLTAHPDFLPPQGEAFGGGRCAVAGLPACRTDGGKK